MATHFTPASCPTCDTQFDAVAVEYDEDGGYIALQVTPCDSCGTLLCGCCPQFHCDGCGMTFCDLHLVSVPDGTERPLKCCAACASECEPMELPAPIPPQRETRFSTPAIAACGGCFGAVTIFDAQTSNGAGETWHTRCWNRASEKAAMSAAEYDEAPALPARRAMGAAKAASSDIPEVA